MPSFDFNKTARLLRQARPGQEPTMYAHLRDLFSRVLGHPLENISIDSTQPETGGNRPDLAIRCDTGLADAKGRAIYHDWIVAEVKADKQAFLDDGRREQIFNDKKKYIRPETEWFVMADPACIIIRPIAARHKISAEADKVFHWEEFASAEDFREKLKGLHIHHVADSPALAAFRSGDSTRIAVVKVAAPDDGQTHLSEQEREAFQLAKKDFLDAIRAGTRVLQGACREALTEWAPLIESIASQADAFKKEWNGYELSFDPPAISGKRPITGSEEKQRHDAEAKALKTVIAQNLAAARLALIALPAYYQRSIKTSASDDQFAAESANLMLARILLLRFFEDHHFFDEKKYVCNGGVAVLQDFMGYYEKGYDAVLRDIYAKGGEVYSEAFDRTDLDWVLHCQNKSVSRAIELTMMLLSRFDFSTVSGDILTGIYDRFLDSEQRKEMGEFYTPPSVARYIIRRLDIQPGESVFDPACGSGTFLLEAFECLTRGDIRGGRGDYALAERALAHIGGNDLNPFSAVMAQIQFLWHLLPLKSALKERGFPAIRIAGSNNAIAVSGDLHDRQDSGLYADLNRSSYAAVIGNPPYVRPERSGDFDSAAQSFYEEIGGANKNFYDLFIYKALARWCRKGDQNAAPGKLGFVAPLSFCDSENSRALRRLFEVGGRFRLLEIVDMEMIAPKVFDAVVNPIVLLAENRPATSADKVCLRVAGAESIAGEHEFDLERAPSNRFNYQDIFTDDGRILTKFNKARKRIIDRMRQADNTLADIARVYWVGIGKGGRIAEWRASAPEDALLAGNDSAGRQGLRWEKRYMLGEGAISRRKAEPAAGNDGLDYYKGENISACLVEGDAARKNMIPESFNSPSFWRCRDILPSVGYAFLGISLGITATRFNPHEYAFLSTATLLFPDKQWENFPLDMALTSRIYQFYSACYLRESPVSAFYSHVYTRTLRKIPLPSALLRKAAPLEKLRESFLDLCEKIHNRAGALAGFLRAVATVRLRDACREKNLTIKWSEGFRDGQAIAVDAPALDSLAVKDSRLLLGEEWIEIADADILHCLAAALLTRHGRELKQPDMQKMLMPASAKDLADFRKEVRQYEAGAYDDKLERVLAKTDAIVGAAFGLQEKEISDVQRQMREDSFLRHIRPKLPHAERRRRGLNPALADPARYQRKL